MAFKKDSQVDHQGLECALHEPHHIGSAAGAANIDIHFYVVPSPADRDIEAEQEQAAEKTTHNSEQEEGIVERDRIRNMPEAEILSKQESRNQS
jgi:hypothetical protein